MNLPKPRMDRRLHIRRVPTQSFFYDRILPMIFIALGFIMVALIVIAAGVLLGFVRYQ